MDLEIAASARGPATVLALSGDVDIHTAPALRERLAAAEGVVVVDLSAVDFLDSSALGVLVGACAALAEAGGSLRLACPRPHARKIFRITRLAEVIGVYDDVDAACTA